MANPLSEEAPLLRTSVLSTPAGGAAAQRLPRPARRRAVRDRAWSPVPSCRCGSRRSPASTRRPDDETLQQILARRAAPAAPGRRSSSPATPTAAGGGAPDGPPTGPTPSARRAPWRAALAVDADRDRRPSTHRGTRAGARGITLADGTLVGHAGELHPKALAALGLPARTCAAELDVDVLSAAGDTVVEARALSTYPVAHSDVALVVPADVPAAEVEAALRRGAGDLLESLPLFDVYTGEQVGDGSTSPWPTGCVPGTGPHADDRGGQRPARRGRRERGGGDRRRAARSLT